MSMIMGKNPILFKKGFYATESEVFKLVDNSFK